MQGPLCHPGTLCLQPSAPRSLGQGAGRSQQHAPVLGHGSGGKGSSSTSRSFFRTTGGGGAREGPLEETWTGPCPSRAPRSHSPSPTSWRLLETPRRSPHNFLGAFFLCVWSPVSPVSAGWAQGNTWRWGKRSQSWPSVQRIREQPAGEAPRQLQAARCRQAQRGADLGNSDKRGKCRNFTAESG